MIGPIARRSVSGFLLAGSFFFIAPASSPAEPAQAYFSLNSLYGMAADRQHIRDFGAAFEMPMGRGVSAVARGRYLRVKQEPWNETERRDNVYADMFPSRYQIAGVQAALRLRPWEWMEGFFSEALLGYKQIRGGDPEPRPVPSFEGYTGAPGVASFTNHAFEAALGFGYMWEMKRMRVALGFAFGPEFLVRNDKLTDGSSRSTGEILDLLRFNQFEVGYAF
jgi:hypothetical protein